MAKRARPAFDPKQFLATANRGRAVSDHPRDSAVYRQGGPADAVFYIQKGRVKITVASQQGKEAVIAMMGPDSSSAKDVW
jgi:CRP-like cAMP-binding protein